MARSRLRSDTKAMLESTVRMMTARLNAQLLPIDNLSVGPMEEKKQKYFLDGTTTYLRVRFPLLHESYQGWVAALLGYANPRVGAEIAFSHSSGPYESWERESILMLHHKFSGRDDLLLPPLCAVYQEQGQPGRVEKEVLRLYDRSRRKAIADDRLKRIVQNLFAADNTAGEPAPPPYDLCGKQLLGHW